MPTGNDCRNIIFFFCLWPAILLSCLALMAQPSAFYPDGDVPDWERPTSTEAAPPPEDPIAHFIESQPLAAKIAQLMLITVEGATTPSVNDIAFFRTTLPGGVVVPHAHKPAVGAAYVNKLREFERSSGVPLLIGVDLYQFTGAIRTTPSQFLQLPSMLSLAAVGDPDITRRAGRFMADHVRGMGFNLHLGPFLALAPTLAQSTHGAHTFGSDPRFAAETGALLVESFNEAGLVSMPLGFPGGGANKSARGPAVLTTPRPTLMDTDGLPYLELVRRGVRMMHVGNTLSPTLDMDNRPASMSRTVIREILRDELRFDGVIVAGPMDDDVIKARYEPSEAAVMALAAGADMLLWSGGLLPPARAIERITAHVGAGHISEERIDDSLRRVLALKHSLTPPEKAITEKQAERLSREKELREISLDIERRAITLMQNRHNVLPLVNRESTPVGITGVAGVDELREMLEKQLKPVVQQRITTARHIGEIQRFEIERLTRHMRGLRTVVCILTDDVRVETQIELIRALKSNAPYVVVLYLGNPAGAARLTEADALLLAYCDPVMLNQTMQAMSDILIGKGPVAIIPVPDEIQMRVGEERSFNAYEIIRAPSGRLPVSLGEAFPAGASARYHPGESVRRVEWNIAGRRIRRDSVTHAFDAPGAYTVTLSITDLQGDVQSRTFTITVRD